MTLCNWTGMAWSDAGCSLTQLWILFSNCVPGYNLRWWRSNVYLRRVGVCATRKDYEQRISCTVYGPGTNNVARDTVLCYPRRHLKREEVCKLFPLQSRDNAVANFSRLFIKTYCIYVTRLRRKNSDTLATLCCELHFCLFFILQSALFFCIWCT
jgi:hypothetical protein